MTPIVMRLPDPLPRTGKRAVAPKKLYIPPISEKRLQALAAHIKPIVRFAHGTWRHRKAHNIVVRRWFEHSPTDKLTPYRDGQPYFVEVADLRQSDLTADPKPLDRTTNLEEIRIVEVLYPVADSGPTVAHVLAQISRDLVNDVTAYEIIRLNREVTMGPNHRMALVALYA